MKKRTLLASMIALIAGGMMGATSPMPSTQSAQSQQVDQSSKSASGPAQEQSTARQSRPSTAGFATDFGKYLPSAVGYQQFTKQRSWCSYASGAFNRIKHGRSTRRKHRRA